MRRKDPIFRVASALHRRLSRFPDPADAPFNNGISELMVRQAVLNRLLKQIVLAKHHGWHLAAQRLKEDLRSDIWSVTSACQKLIDASAPVQIPAISLQSIVDELRQLEGEFEQVDVSQRVSISVTSQAIELEGIFLGRFAIELHFGRLSDKPGSSRFVCTALDPNPASGSEDVTHPHVRDGELCAGDATLPIAAALRQRRICDAFCLVHSVLQTYNPNSPYISLENWNGVSCSDCSYSTDRDNLYSCNGCGCECCEECISKCDVCSSYRCCGCLERDEISDRHCCAGCQRQCAECKRIVDKESFDRDTRLCPGCLEEHQAEDDVPEDQLVPPTDNSNKENDHESILRPALCAQDAPAATLAAGKAQASSAA